MRVLAKLTAAIALSATLLAGGCTDQYGRTDWGRTALLGVGIAAVTGVAIAASNSGGHHHRDRGPVYGAGYGRGYGGGYRGW